MVLCLSSKSQASRSHLIQLPLIEILDVLGVLEFLLPAFDETVVVVYEHAGVAALHSLVVLPHLMLPGLLIIDKGETHK